MPSNQAEYMLDLKLWDWAEKEVKRINDLYDRFITRRELPVFSYYDAVIFDCVKKIIRKIETTPLSEQTDQFIATLESNLRFEKEYAETIEDKINKNPPLRKDFCKHIGRHQSNGPCGNCNSFSGGF